jgi:hypothetical protein
MGARSLPPAAEDAGESQISCAILWKTEDPAAVSTRIPKSCCGRAPSDRHFGRCRCPTVPVFSRRALRTIPLAVRTAAATCGFAAYLAPKRSVFVGVAVGETVLLLGGLLFVH